MKKTNLMKTARRRAPKPKSNFFSFFVKEKMKERLISDKLLVAV